MADIKDKVITAESLLSLHEYNSNTYGTKEDVENLLGDVDELIGTLGYTKKNLIPYPYSVVTHTVNGLTFTDNGDGTVGLSGTATQDTSITLVEMGAITLKVGEYILTGCPDGGSEDGYMLKLNMTYGSFDFFNTNYEGRTTFKISEEVSAGICIDVKSGTTVNNLTFYPMLRYASIDDDTYESYTRDVITRFKQFGNLKWQSWRTSDSSYNAKPWLVLKDNIGNMNVDCIYTGMIISGSKYMYIGWKYSDRYASFLILGYQKAMYHTLLQQGVWYNAEHTATYTEF